MMFKKNYASALVSFINVLLVSMVLTSCSSEEPAEFVQNVAESTAETVSAEKKPNFLLIVADDLGYSDLGVFGGEIGTPTLDELANSGIQLTNFHTAATCSPTRSMLLTGMDNHLAGLGAMNEAKRGLKLPEEVMASPGYAGHLNNRVAALPEVLKEAGYRTYMSGKWHLGHGDEQSPHARGFDKTFTLLEGGAGHLSNMNVIPFNKREHALYRKNGEMTGIPDDFYSTEFYANTLIDYLQEDKDSEKPFFAYLAFTAPHWPLQAPKESIERFKGRYDEGYEVIFNQRIAKQKALGLITEKETGQDLIDASPWDALSGEEKARQIRAMEVYAAMVNDMDMYIGKVVQALKDIGEYENTVIFFMSDNGSEYGTLDWMPNKKEFIERCCDDSLENMGAANSYVLYDSGWARVSGAPSKYFKSHTTQGGILSPAIVHYPQAENTTGRYTEFLSVMDIMPTFLDLAGVTHPAPEFQGREVLPMKGASMSPILDGSSQKVHGPDYMMGWELHYHKAVRKGDWKITFSRPPLGDNTWKLYDLSSDPFEHHDLSETHPEKMQEMLAEWERYAEENGVYVPGQDT